MIPCCCNTRCIAYKGLYMKYMLGQFWVAHKYRDNKFVKMWLDETRFQRDAASAVRTKAFDTLLKNAKDDEAAALKVLQAGGYVLSHLSVRGLYRPCTEAMDHIL